MLHQGMLLLCCSGTLLWNIPCTWEKIMAVKAGITLRTKQYQYNLIPKISNHMEL
ncbi:hypothetical protein KC19_10G023800 [Ceratodon purpureus]|uniref:Uncharacterized protein n=1 Tax=Ceratodon purpureus TaxID=3225 RepID=A0A8T0GH77_CERPU|nr:hypothetical protein KC19_10G023800 [Ceratodon purpureus]